MKCFAAPSRRSALWRLTRGAANAPPLFPMLLFLAAGGCGEITVAASGLGGVGESCTRTADCATSLVCIASVCQASGDVVQPDASGEADVSGGAGPDGSEGDDVWSQADVAVGPVLPAQCTGTCPTEWKEDGTCNPECNCASEGDGPDCDNLCTNAGDAAVWKVGGFELEPGRCWTGCEGDEDQTSCTHSCLNDDKGLSSECADCFAEFIGCIASECDAGCLSTPAEASCEACANEHCWQSFYNCSGAI